MKDITPIIQAAIALIAVLISVFVIPYIKSKTTVAQRQELTGWISVAVSAAEQLFIGSGRGKEKKQYVLKMLQTYGYTVNFKKIDLLIEAEVYKLNQQKGVSNGV